MLGRIVDEDVFRCQLDDCDCGGGGGGGEYVGADAGSHGVALGQRERCVLQIGKYYVTHPAAKDYETLGV